MHVRYTFLAAAALASGACTPNDNDVSALDSVAVVPSEQNVRADTVHPSQDPARTGRCDELSGDAMRDCLERAQYMPENVQGLAGEAATRRQDPNQIDPALRARARFDDQMRNPSDPDNAAPRLGEGRFNETTGDTVGTGTGDGNDDEDRQ